jgi:hypothetical protein
MVERSARGSGGVEVSPAGLRVRGRAVRMELSFGTAAPVELTSTHGGREIWTRKRAGVPVRGWVEVHGERRAVALRGVVDESRGHHARQTSWRWSAGVGTAASGAAVAWNLVDGIHDGAERSERAVWVDGEPHAVRPVDFDPGLAWVAPRGAPPAGPAGAAPGGPAGAAPGGPAGAPPGGPSGAPPGGPAWRLAFAAEATRARREDLLVVASDYEAPFGSFSGTLPVAGALREGWGVMERHEATW